MIAIKRPSSAKDAGRLNQQLLKLYLLNGYSRALEVILRDEPLIGKATEFKEFSDKRVKLDTKRINRTLYYIVFADGSSMDIPKMVYDALALPLLDATGKPLRPIYCEVCTLRIITPSDQERICIECSEGIQRLMKRHGFDTWIMAQITYNMNRVEEIRREHPNVRHMECCCCGGDAGYYEQHWNRDTGYGICRKCIDTMTKAGMQAKDILDLYGKEGINYAAEV